MHKHTDIYFLCLFLFIISVSAIHGLAILLWQHVCLLHRYIDFEISFASICSYLCLCHYHSNPERKFGDVWIHKSDLVTSM